MALNFPINPTNGDTYTEGTTTWIYDGTAWNVTQASSARNIYTTVTGDTGTTTADIQNDTLTVAGGTNITTEVTDDTLTINFSGSVGSTQNLFDKVTSDDGTATASSTTDTLRILGGTNISTTVPTDTKDVTINLDSFPISGLSNVSSTAPSTGQVLKWDGSQWAPGVDATTGGAGTDADTLDGFDGSYYLDYNNLSNKPAILTLASISVGVENSASGNGAISYDNTTGEFRYTPPTAAGIGAIASEVNDLTAAVTWANVPDANITQTSVTQHQAALSILEGQISDLQNYLTSVSASDLNSISIDALSDVNTTTQAPTDGQVLSWDNGNGYWKPATVAGGGGGGEANQNAFSNLAVAGQSTIEADTSTDTLTVAAGSGISITTNAGTDTLTITSTVSGGATSFQGLSDRPTGYTPYMFVESAIARLLVTNNSSSSYRFTSHYGNTDNPTIYAISGTTIAFDLTNIGASHPFQIQSGGGASYDTGLLHITAGGTVTEGASANAKTGGVLYWRIPQNISGNYRYQCTSHGGMLGTITIKQISTI